VSVFDDNPDAIANRQRKALALADELSRRGYFADTLPAYAVDESADRDPERRRDERRAGVSRCSQKTWAMARGYMQMREHVARTAEQAGLIAVPRASGIGAAAIERVRQVDGEGYDSQVDDSQVDEQLAESAACYALPWRHRPYGDAAQIPAEPATDPRSAELSGGLWPWDVTFWRPSPENRRRELEKAMALLAAEWDRLDRAERRQGANQAAELAQKRAEATP